MTETPRPARGGVRALLLAGALLLLGGGAWLLLRSDPATATGPAPPRYVGRAACVECHRREDEAFRGSHHDRAMDPATPETVLGDFDGATFTHQGVTSTFTRDGDRFVVRTDGPDGALHDYPVAWVFGFTPLQQYLIDLGRGRLQCLTIAWDSRPEAAGGQRWFHLYPDEPTPAGDELHWTGIQQNWNYMCAECHSTNLRRGYDAEADAYHTTWDEIDVSCEACHGPASDHVAWADGDPAFAALGAEPGKGLVVAFDERRGVAFTPDPATGLPARNMPRTTQKELDTCARCHSRRSVFHEDFVPGRPLLDTHYPSLLTEGLYHVDGQMQDEVYVYQSFLQSRMSAAGVTCSDCHDPHSATLRRPGNEVCAQCHDPGRYDSRTHHFHPPGSDSARCVACHAPTVTYMGVDPRHDHGFRVPRPDLAARFGVPDACTGCHTDHAPSWAADRLVEWYGGLRTDRAPHTAAFAAARAGSSGAAPALLALARDAAQPGIVRATALHELPLPLAPESVAAARRMLGDADPLLRWTAARVLADAPAEQRAELRPLLRDPVRGVRAAAARALVGAPTAGWSAADLAAHRDALAEYVAGERCNADRPESRMNLGNFAREQQRYADAEAEYRAALRLHPLFLAAYVNLADLYRELGREEDCEQTLRDGLARAPQDASLQHALGLCLVRRDRIGPAVAALAAAAAAAPTNARYVYAHAAGLQAVGQLEDAVAALEAATRRLPEDRALVELLVDCLQQQGDLDGARRHAADYAQRWPDDPVVQRWLGGLLR